MFPERLKSSMRKLFNTMGIEVHRRDSRSSLLGVLRTAKKAGLLPGTVIDVGAAYGSFVSQCCKVFPALDLYVLSHYKSISLCWKRSLKPY